MLKNKRLIILSICLMCVISLAVGIYIHFFGTYNLVFLEDSQSIIFSDSWTKVTAVVSEAGNVFVRGEWVDEPSPFGVEDIRQYRNQYNLLDFSKADRFVEIYNGNDAISVELSDLGGVIITKQNQAVLFVHTGKYRLPSFFCEDVLKAKLYGTRVYILSTDGCFGYRDISSPSSWTLICENVKDFSIPDGDHTVWLLSTENELVVYKEDDGYDSALVCLKDVACFDVLCAETPDVYPSAKYSLGIVLTNGTPLYYNGKGIPTEESKFEEYPVKAHDVLAYSNGIIILDQNGIATIYGKEDLIDVFYQGELLAENVIDFSSSIFSVNLITKDQGMLCIGSLPSSRWIEFRDVIEMDMDSRP